MVQFIRDLFSESGNVSMTRVLALVCVINATLIALWGIFRGADLGQVSMLCGTFLASGLGAKVTQKYIENKD